MRSMISTQLPTIIVFLALSAILSPVPAQKCIDQPNPFKPYDFTRVDCKLVTERSVAKRDNYVNDTTTTNMFEIAEFHCTGNNTALCDNMKKSFETAGQMISQVFCLKTPIKLNVSCLDFCNGLSDCSDERFIDLGFARPVRSMLMQDDDGVTRFYPQALVKQYQMQTHPEFTSIDITATFNTQVKWWFRQDQRQIGEKEFDFLTVCLHELFHGLGFQSYWSDWLNPSNASEALTPYPIISLDPKGSGLVIFDGFHEHGFDKYLITLPSGQRVSDFNKQLNKFAGGPGAKFANVTDFISQFRASPQYEIAKEMLKKAIIADDLGFLPQGVSNVSDCAIMETSINPYALGSNLEHLSEKHYANSSDFLMVFRYKTNQTLEDQEKRSGNLCFGAIGPKLRLIMQTLGYCTSNNSAPYQPTLPPFDPLAGPLGG
ncbi:3199_t:CDS:2 [Acaulospora morrowiae]|uniref:3199_t:CDS:1 n=1 Tax=Acaulospora morrowiae TaxID=94023 RepID=A0A9N8YT87_9GLOM|nr:3199_t:CDS:2 [Acaulospora morrowiae]